MLRKYIPVIPYFFTVIYTSLFLKLLGVLTFDPLSTNYPNLIYNRNYII